MAAAKRKEDTGATTQKAVIESLMRKLRSGRVSRGEQVQKMKECAEEVARGTPADSSLFLKLPPAASPAAEPEDDMGSGIRKMPNPQERLAARQQQMRVLRAKSKSTLNAFKQTTMRAVQSMRETEVYSPEELQARLTEEHDRIADITDESDPE